MADNLIFKAGDKLTRTDCKLKVFAFAAVKCNAVNKAFKINNCDVVFFNCSVFNGDNSCVSLLKILKLFFNLCRRNGCVCLNGFKSLLLANLDFGFNGNFH